MPYLSITTITLCIAQKMQEAERIFNHHVYNVGNIRCIHDDLKSSCFLYLLSHNQREYYHNHIRYCTENVCIVINLTTIMISHAIIESCIFCYFLTCFCCLRYLVLGIVLITNIRTISTKKWSCGEDHTLRSDFVIEIH